MGQFVTFCFAVSLVLVVLPRSNSLKTKTLLISLDGFRWDYISKTTTPNFERMLMEGSQVKKVTNAYATLTMPNHYTLVTGLYEDQHGIIANKFYDSNYDDTYSFSTDTKWYNATEPVWITGVKEGKKTGAYMWVGNEAVYDGKTANKVIPFKSGTEFEDGLDIAVHWLAEDDLDFACVYTNEPDSTGHSDGPDSDMLKLKIRQLDHDIGQLLDKVEQLGLTDKLNILIASDHGMTNVSNTNTINLGAYVNFTADVEWSYTSAVGLIIPKPGRLDTVYDQLKVAERDEGHMKVYKKDEIPAELHYKNNSRIPELVIVAENGWLLQKSRYTVDLKGNHGFDNTNDDMKTTFLARGPNFKCGYQQEAMKSVDLYPLLCHLMELKTCHNSPGRLSVTEALLSSENCVPDYPTTAKCVVCAATRLSIALLLLLSFTLGLLLI